MQDTVFIVFNRHKVIRMNNTYVPSLKSGEYMIRVRFQVPQSYFDRSIPTAEIMVPESSIVAAPIEVDVQMPDGSEPNDG